MEVIITFKFENPGEAENFAETLRTYPAAEKANELEQIGDGDIVLVRATGGGAVKGILESAAETIVVEGKYPWKKTETEEG